MIIAKAVISKELSMEILKTFIKTKITMAAKR